MSQTAPPTPGQKDEATHLESLAHETDTSLHVVRAIYSDELRALEEQARIRTFLTVIAMRRTRLILENLDGSAAQLDMH